MVEFNTAEAAAEVVDGSGPGVAKARAKSEPLEKSKPAANSEAGLIVFEFGGAKYPLRTGDKDGVKVWVTEDACAAMAIANASDAASTLDPDEKDTIGLPDSIGRIRQKPVVTMPGLLRLMAKSQTPQAKTFQRFMFHDVMPSVVTTGTYTMPGHPAQQSLARVDAAAIAEIVRSELEGATQQLAIQLATLKAEIEYYRDKAGQCRLLDKEEIQAIGKQTNKLIDLGQEIRPWHTRESIQSLVCKAVRERIGDTRSPDPLPRKYWTPEMGAKALAWLAKKIDRAEESLRLKKEWEEKGVPTSSNAARKTATVRRVK